MLKEALNLRKKKIVNNLRNEYTDLVTKEKENYLSNLGTDASDPRTACKKYWTCLKKLLNKNKASLIPPLLENGLFITDIIDKCRIFNSYFQSQCTILDTSSVLPSFLKKRTKVLIKSLLLKIKLLP